MQPVVHGQPGRVGRGQLQINSVIIATIKLTERVVDLARIFGGLGRQRHLVKTTDGGSWATADQRNPFTAFKGQIGLIIDRCAAPVINGVRGE